MSNAIDYEVQRVGQMVHVIVRQDGLSMPVRMPLLQAHARSLGRWLEYAAHGGSMPPAPAFADGQVAWSVVALNYEDNSGGIVCVTLTGALSEVQMTLTRRTAVEFARQLRMAARPRREDALK